MNTPSGASTWMCTNAFSSSLSCFYCCLLLLAPILIDSIDELNHCKNKQTNKQQQYHHERNKSQPKCPNPNQNSPPTQHGQWPKSAPPSSPSSNPTATPFGNPPPASPTTTPPCYSPMREWISTSRCFWEHAILRWRWRVWRGPWIVKSVLGRGGSIMIWMMLGRMCIIIPSLRWESFWFSKILLEYDC